MQQHWKCKKYTEFDSMQDSISTIEKDLNFTVVNLGFYLKNGNLKFHLKSHS